MKIYLLFFLNNTLFYQNERKTPFFIFSKDVASKLRGRFACLGLKQTSTEIDPGYQVVFRASKFYKSLARWLVMQVARCRTLPILYDLFPFSMFYCTIKGKMFKNLIISKESTLLDVMQIKFHDLLLNVTLICYVS